MIRNFNGLEIVHYCQWQVNLILGQLQTLWTWTSVVAIDICLSESWQAMLSSPAVVVWFESNAVTLRRHLYDGIKHPHEENIYIALRKIKRSWCVPNSAGIPASRAMHHNQSMIKLKSVSSQTTHMHLVIRPCWNLFASTVPTRRSHSLYSCSMLCQPPLIKCVHYRQRDNQRLWPQPTPWNQTSSSLNKTWIFRPTNRERH